MKYPFRLKIIWRMKIRIRKSAIKVLESVSSKEREKIHNKILELKNFPDVTNVKKLTDFEPAYRLWIGNYRVLFDIKEDTIDISRVLHRKESYRWYGPDTRLYRLSRDSVSYPVRGANWDINLVKN